jgi:hypothetical protein
VPTVTLPAIGVDRDKFEVAPGFVAVEAGVGAGAAPAAIKGRLMEVMRAKASSFFMFVLLERGSPKVIGIRVLQEVSILQGGDGCGQVYRTNC